MDLSELCQIVEHKRDVYFPLTVNAGDPFDGSYPG